MEQLGDGGGTRRRHKRTGEERSQEESLKRVRVKGAAEWRAGDVGELECAREEKTGAVEV